MHHHHRRHAPHDATETSLDRRLLATVALNASITAAESAAGMVSGSLALLSDAAHNLGDVVAVILALLARKLGRKPPTLRHTYGFKRLEVIGALINAIVLISVTVLIAREAWERLLNPRPVSSNVMLSFGLLALAVNLGSVLLLRRHDHADVNTRGAFLHMIQDACASLAVVVAALLERTAMGPYVDPAVALIVGALVLRSAFSLAWETLSTMLEGAPRDVDIRRLADAVADAFEPIQMHHVHVWVLSPSQRLLTAHVALGQEMSGREIENLLGRIRLYLHEHWGIDHSTLEPEVLGCSSTDLLGRWEHCHQTELQSTVTHD